MLKKLLSGLITVSLLLSSAVVPAAADDNSVNVVTTFSTDNLIVNGGFENGLDGWVIDDTGVFTVVENTFTGSNNATMSVINGTKAVKATVTNTTTKGSMYQEVEVTANTNYVLNLSWFHLSNTKGSVKIYGDSVSDANLLASVGNIFGGEVWYSSTCAFNSGEYEKVIVKIDMFNPDPTKYSSLYYCIDNITLKAAGNTQTIDFESGYPEDLNIRSSQFTVTDQKPAEGKDVPDMGNYSLKLTAETGNPIATAAFAVNPERHYAVMFWYYIESGSLGAASKFAHENGWSGYTTSPIRSQTLTGTGEWKRAIMTPGDGVSGTGANKFVELAFQNLAPNTVVYIDNIQCKYYDESVDSITIAGKNERKGMLQAEVEAYNYGYNFEDPVTYQWQRSADKKAWSDIEGATEADYNLAFDDSEKYLRVKVNTSNRYSTGISDAYYSKAIKINDFSYKHKKGSEYGVELQNESFDIKVEESDAEESYARFEFKNKTDDAHDFIVFVGAYSKSGELINYALEEYPQVTSGGVETVNTSFTESGINNFEIIVYDADMNVYYAENIKNLGIEQSKNEVFFDRRTQTVEISGANNGNAELVIIKNESGGIEYISAITCDGKAGYKVSTKLKDDAYGKYYIYTKHYTEPYIIECCSEEEFVNVALGYFDEEMDANKVLDAYYALDVNNGILEDIDVEKLVAAVNANKSEVTGDTVESKKESAENFLERTLVLEAYNQGISGITNESGKIIYEDALKLTEIDNGETTFYDLYNTSLTKDGLDKLNDMLSGQNFGSLSDFNDCFKESVLLCAIAHPVSEKEDYIGDILTYENMDDIGVDYSMYDEKTPNQKKQIRESIAKKSFASIDDLEAELNKDLEKPNYDLVEVNDVTKFRTENMIINGGFEEGLDGWTTDESGVFSIVENTFAGTNDVEYQVVNGKKAVKAASSGTTTAGFIYQEIDATPNTNYVLNFSWFNMSTAVGSVKVYGDSLSGKVLATAGNIFGGEVWYSSTTAFNSAEYEKLIVKIDFSNAEEGKYYCLDNITLKAAGNTQTIDFEKGYPENFNTRATVFEVTDENAKEEGKHSIKLTSGEGYQLASMAFALNPGRKYQISFDYYIESGALGYALKHAHENGWSGYTTSAITSQTLTGTGEWKTFTYTGEAINDDATTTGITEGSFVELAFQNMHLNTVAYIDNIVCKAVDTPIESIAVTGANGSGGSVSAKVDADFDKVNVSYQWQRSDDKNTWIDITGATDTDYRLTRFDSQKYLRVKVNTYNVEAEETARTVEPADGEYYSKAIKINDVLYKHLMGLSYGVEMQNEFFSIEDTGTYANLDFVNKTAGELDFYVFIGAYSDGSEILNYIVEKYENIAADGRVRIVKLFTEPEISNLKIIVFGTDMKVYYAEDIKNLGVEQAENEISFAQKNQIVTITGVNINSPELVIIKDNEGRIEYITVADCEGKAGYKSTYAIKAGEYGKYHIYTTSNIGPRTITYYSPADYERIVNSFSSELNKEQLLEAYDAFEITSTLLNKVDIDKLVAVANGCRSEVSGNDIEAKKESVVKLLKKMPVIEAYNESLLGLADSDGKIIYRDELELEKIDNSSTTFVKMYDTFLSKQGLSYVNSMLAGKNFKNSNDFNSQFKKAVILYAIAYPSVNGGGYIAEILTDANMNSAGINYSVYATRNATQKQQINDGIVRKLFTDIAALETEINKELPADPGNGSNGSSGSSSSSGSGSFGANSALSVGGNPSTGYGNTFTDITDEHWAYKYVYALKELGIVSGVDEQHFEPNGLVTREQFVKMICDAFGLTLVSQADNTAFADCTENAWYEQYIKIAVSQGIISGIGNGMFGVGRPITREDLCVIAVRALNDVAIESDVEFVDKSEISDYAKSAVATLAAMKVISGFEDGSVRAKEFCTRAQAAKIIYELRAIKEIQQ